MKIFGYQNDSENLLKLEEVSISCNIEELDKIVKFLYEVKNKHAAVADKTDVCHSHFRDWDLTWKKGRGRQVGVSLYINNISVTSK